MARYDPARLADMVDQESKLRADLGEAATEMNDLYARDGALSDGQMARYMLLGQRHRQLSDQLGLVSAERRAYELREPARAQAATRTPFARWMCAGARGLDEAEQRHYLGADDIMRPSNADGPSFILGRSLAAAVDDSNTVRSDDGSGQKLVQPEVVPTIVDRLSYYGGVAKMAQHLTTATGAELRWPTEDSASQEGEVLDGQATPAAVDPPPDIGQQMLGSRTISSKVIPVTREMMQDGVIDYPTYAERRLIRRIGRTSEKRFTTRPNPFPTGSIDAVVSTAAAGVTTAAQTVVTWPEVTRLIYSVNRAYRDMAGESGEGGLSVRAGRVGYLISDSAELALRTMVDGDSRPLWVPSTREGAPSMIGGYPYEVGGYMDGLTAGKTPILFGNFGYFLIRTVQQIEIFRITDGTTLQRNSVWFLAFCRRFAMPIGAIVNSKCEAYAKLTMAA